MLHEKDPSKIGDQPSDYEFVKVVKEKKCFVTQDFDAELKQATEHNKILDTYQLPGGDNIELNKERI